MAFQNPPTATYPFAAALYVVPGGIGSWCSFLSVFSGVHGTGQLIVEAVHDCKSILKASVHCKVPRTEEETGKNFRLEMESCFRC